MAERTDDELDDLVRAAMKTLDAQVPSGYFDALAGRTLARLASSEATMQTGTSSTEATSSGVPPTPTEEDSGLHDIRNLAETAKARISNQRISTGSVKTDDELLASASGSWKSLALPQPASMISLPDLAEGTLVDKKADKKAEKKAEKADAPVTAAAVVAAKPSARVSTLRKRVAIAGIGLAAAAGVTLFLTMRPDAEPAAEHAPVVTASTPSVAPAQPVVQPIEVPKAAPAAEPPTGAAAATADVAAAPAPEPAKVATKRAATKPVAHAATKTVAAAEPKAAAPAPAPAAKAKKDDSFDTLLKEAGVAEKKDAKPVLDKKELSAADFKTGMAAIQSKAATCYKGTQGMAQVKVVIAPSGKVSRVTVSGPFAGKPEGDCVTAAAKSASFPAWDGGPQTMGYSFLLSE